MSIVGEYYLAAYRDIARDRPPALEGLLPIPGWVIRAHAKEVLGLHGAEMVELQWIVSDIDDHVIEHHRVEAEADKKAKTQNKGANSGKAKMRMK